MHRVRKTEGEWCSTSEGVTTEDHEVRVGARALTVINFGNSMVFVEACKRSCDSK